MMAAENHKASNVRASLKRISEGKMSLPYIPGLDDLTTSMLSTITEQYPNPNVRTPFPGRDWSARARSSSAEVRELMCQGMLTQMQAVLQAMQNKIAMEALSKHYEDNALLYMTAEQYDDFKREQHFQKVREEVLAKIRADFAQLRLELMVRYPPRMMGIDYAKSGSDHTGWWG
jgi:hypothetical protein